MILVTGSVILVAMGKSETVILTVAGIIVTPILGAFGASVLNKLDQVKEISNGNLTRKDDQNEAQVQQLVQLTSQLLALVAQTHPGIPKEVSEKMMPMTIPALVPATLPDYAGLNVKQP